MRHGSAAYIIVISSDCLLAVQFTRLTRRVFMVDDAYHCVVGIECSEALCVATFDRALKYCNGYRIAECRHGSSPWSWEAGEVARCKIRIRKVAYGDQAAA